MSKHQTNTTIWNRLRRGLAGLLTLALLIGLIPGTAVTAYAASDSSHWAMPYAEKLVNWGVMRGDINGNLNLDRGITRAEFVTMMNRAYGYTKLGGHPFTDVTSRDWFSEDIDIAYNMGYFYGTSPTTASPLLSLSREQATVLLARNMMLQTKAGESLGFSDSRQLSEWSRGLVAAAAESGLVTGTADGSFQPTRAITRGEVAAMLTRAIGTPIQTKGDHTLGNVYGNVTVNTAGVKLRDGIIAGNLYLTGGIDLGDVLLENVTVLGEIIISGGGESHSSESSVTLRNVAAENMVVDSISDQFVTIRAEGNTDIPTTTVRTNAYVDDSSLPGFGLSFIELDGDAGTMLQLAGNVKEVWNRTPESDLQVVQGVADKITVDEYATGSTVLIDGDARVEELNLDVATTVTGAGDIKDLNVGAAGSTVEQLPDKITIRPGITSNINGSDMNSTQAAESSSDPRLLAGYPKVKNIAPNSATLVFSVNKPGTIYWAVTAVADGSVDEDDLIEPPVYGGNIIRSGSIRATAANTEYTVNLTGLTQDGSYYVSAILVDGRDNRSPVKVTAFTTPDGTIPAFLSTEKTKESTEIAQITVMPNKSCLLYYALLPAGSAAPTSAELKANAVRGNLGYGSLDVTKNVNTSINVNRVPLQEKTNYDLYLWLTDHDGAKSMAAPLRVTFNIPDETPPNVTVTQAAPYAPSSAQAEYTMDEEGSVIWAVVTKATHEENGFINFAQDKGSMEAKIKVQSGRTAGALASGTANRSPFTISPLNFNQTNTNSYVLYYLGRDRAGNLSKEIKMVEIRTTDTQVPTVEQHFTDTKDRNDDTKDPYAHTGIRLEFDENVKGGTGSDKIFLELYTRVVEALDSGNQSDVTAARNALNEALREHVVLFRIPTGSSGGRLEEVKHREDVAADSDDWTVDYRYAQVLTEDGKTVIYLPTVITPDGKLTGSALNLVGGGRYYFELRNIRDDSFNSNKLNNKDVNELPPFTTVYAQVRLSSGDQLTGQTVTKPGTGSAEGSESTVRMDATFYVEPESTEKVAPTEHWDLIFWTDTPMSVLFYRRDVTNGENNTGWELLNTDGPVDIRVSGGRSTGISLAKDIMAVDGRTTFPFLNSGNATYMEENHKYQYGLRFTALGNNGLKETDATRENTAWGQLVNMEVSVIAGNVTNLGLVANNVNARYEQAVKEDSVAEIGQFFPANGTVSPILTWPRQFDDRSTPHFTGSYPQITAGSSVINIEVGLNRSGTIYYVVAPAGTAGSVDTLPSGSETNFINKTNDGTIFERINKTKDQLNAMTAAQIQAEVEKNKAAGLVAGSNYAQNKTYIPTGGEDKTKYKDYVASGYGLPTVQDIINPTYPDPVVSGNLPYNNSTVSIEIPDRVASKDKHGADDDDKSVYYVYFVLQGTGNAFSDVEVYRVTMDEVTVPTVTVEGTGTNGTMTPDQESELSYALVDVSRLPSFFMAPGTITTDEEDDDGNPVTMSILTAMIRPLNGTEGKTYFDQYASTGQRNQVVQYILGGNSSIDGGTQNAPAGRWQVPNTRHPNYVRANEEIAENFASAMTSTTAEYVLLAAVRHRYGGKGASDYGFGAVRNLSRPDEVRPSYGGEPTISLAIDKAYDSWDHEAARPSWSANPGNFTYSGSVTITFTKEIYLYDQTTSIPKAVVVQPKTGGTIKSDQISIEDVLGGTARSKLKVSNDLTIKTTRAEREFTLYFDKLAPGDTVTFFRSGLIANGSNFSTGSQLTLTFDPTLTTGYNDVPAPGFRATWK